jgi:YfiH family protein
LLRKGYNGLITYHFEDLPADALVHAVFTRLGGVSRGPFATLNVGRSVGDDEAAVNENHARIYAHMNLDAESVASSYQVHGNRVGIVDANSAGRVFRGTDALVTDVPGIALLLRFADCQPIILYDPVHHALALIHAGWRGIAQGIAFRAVETMQEAFGTTPSRIVAGLGPAIGPCCYLVGDNVAAAMGYALPDWNQSMQAVEGGWRLDLSAANAQQLTAAGMHHIEQAGLCTACHTDEFFSHRAEGGRTGRFAVMVYLKARGGKRGRKARGGLQETSEPPEPVGYDSLNPPGFPTFGELLGSEP